MTNLTLDSYDVQEMNEGEMVNVNGGDVILAGLWGGVAAGVAAVGAWVMTNWADLKTGISDANKDCTCK
jgi:hypothetical protein